MIIRSLLLGSAAALVAASSAQAADAIVVEPEPVEYVRVCDTYGTGFFFIPGTETCIRFSGFIRSVYSKEYRNTDSVVFGTAAQVAAGTATAVGAGTTGENPSAPQTIVGLANGNTISSGTESTWWGHRARFNMDTRNETEWGTLRGLFRLENDSNENTAVRMDVALIELAGFRAGFAGGNYWSTNHGYGGINAEAAQFGFDGFYGFNDATIFDYTFAAEGFSVTIGVEDARRFGINDFDGSADAETYANFYGGFNYSGDWGAVAFTAVHDSDARSISGSTTAASFASSDVGEWAWKASLNLDLSEYIPGGTLWGWYMDDGDAVTEYVRAGNNADTIWGVAFQANLTDEVEFWANYWQADGGWTQLSADGNTVYKEGDSDQWAIGLNWYPSAAPGFDIKVAYMQGNADKQVTRGVAGVAAVAGNAGTAAAGAQISDIEYDAFEIVLRRNF